MNLPLLNKYYEIGILQEGKTYLTSTSNTFKVRFPFSKYPFFIVLIFQGWFDFLSAPVCTINMVKPLAKFAAWKKLSKEIFVPK